MKRRVLTIALTAVAVVALVLVSGCASGGTKTPTTAPQTAGAGGGAVSIANLAFNPSSIDVKVGDTVTWTNNDNVGHTVTGDGGLDSGTIEPGGTFSKKFDTAGTYQYHCSVHPSMTGTVVVK